MAYHESMYFLVFLPVVLIGYQLAPKQVRFGVLLFFSYCFYFLFSHRLIVYLLGATTITYLTGRLVATGEKKRRKTILIVGVWAVAWHAACDEVQRIFCGESECTFRDDELWIPVSGAAVPAATWHLVLHAFCDRLHGGCVLEED